MTEDNNASRQESIATVTNSPRPALSRRLYLVKCSGCGERALPHELVMRAQTQVYHMQCFVCVVCCQLLQKGDQFVLRQGQLLCRADYEKEMFMLQQTQGDFWDAGIPGERRERVASLQGLG